MRLKLSAAIVRMTNRFSLFMVGSCFNIDIKLHNSTKMVNYLMKNIVSMSKHVLMGWALLSWATDWEHWNLYCTVSTNLGHNVILPRITMATLGEVFRSFCSFGSKETGKAPSPMMDNGKFAKMCRDLKLLDKKLTSTDVDITFSKIKPRTE